MNTEAQTRPDVWTRLARLIGRLLGFLLRLLFVLLLAVGVGAGVYYGLPWLYARLVEPVQTNTAQISIVGQRLEILRGNVDQTQATQDDRLTALEISDASRRERLSAVEAALAEVRTAQAADAATRQSVEAGVAALGSASESQARRMADMESALSQLELALDEAAEQQAALRRDMNLMRVQNVLLQARLQFVVENLAGTRQWLEIAGRDLAVMIDTLPGITPERRSLMANRLVNAQVLIRTQPATALQEMESLWLALDGIVHPVEAGSATP